MKNSTKVSSLACAWNILGALGPSRDLLDPQVTSAALPPVTSLGSLPSSISDPSILVSRKRQNQAAASEKEAKGKAFFFSSSLHCGKGQFPLRRWTWLHAYTDTRSSSVILGDAQPEDDVIHSLKWSRSHGCDGKHRCVLRRGAPPEGSCSPGSRVQRWENRKWRVWHPNKRCVGEQSPVFSFFKCMCRGWHIGSTG